jgi:tRNA(Ile)-lysidine synthase
MVSGGADSVALLRLVMMQPIVPDVRIVHVNHRMRGADSDADELLVRDLASSHRLACDVFRAQELPPAAATEAGWRAQRHHAMRAISDRHPGITFALGHTLDDRLETALLRLLRQGEPWSLASMREQSSVLGLRIVRPMLRLRREAVRAWLREIDQPWREDVSNASPKFLRNRVRVWLADHPEVVPDLHVLIDAASNLDRETSELSKSLDPTDVRALRAAPLPVARRCLRAWLASSGISLDDLSARVLDRVLATATDAAAPARLSLPGGYELRRKRHRIELHSPRDR